MILLDTHEWVWWVNGDSALGDGAANVIRTNEANGLGVSVISCWEVAKKVEIGKLILDRDVSEWIPLALGYTGIELIGLTPEIVLESTQLPPPFHRDPADQLIVATARVLGIPLLTHDSRILRYAHVPLAPVG